MRTHSGVVRLKPEPCIALRGETRRLAAKIWFVTGASRGFGREWTIAALERGDSVAATARNTSALYDLTTAHGARLLPT